jgi:hypothetical protein
MGVKKYLGGLAEDLNKNKVKRLELWIPGLLLLTALVVWVPHWQAEQVKTSQDGKVVFGTERFEIENKARTAILQSIGGLFLFMTAFAALRNARAAEENRKIAEDKQVTERFVKAVEMLADEKLEVRLGGIYALERVALDSDRDYWTVIEVLTSFIQEKSPKQDAELVQETSLPVTKDFQAALTVIGRRDAQKDPKDKKLNLRGANLSKAYLNRANFSKAILRGADLRGTYLSGADLSGVNLKEADLSKASLKGTNLSEANLSSAILRGTSFKDADLRNAKFNNGRLSNASFENADLSHAKFNNSSLDYTDFSNANLNGADFSNVSTSYTSCIETGEFAGEEIHFDLTPEHFKKGRNWQKALYDKNFFYFYPDFAEELGLDEDGQVKTAVEQYGA